MQTTGGLSATHFQAVHTELYECKVYGRRVGIQLVWDYESKIPEPWCQNYSKFVQDPYKPFNEAINIENEKYYLRKRNLRTFPKLSIPHMEQISSCETQPQESQEKSQ